MSKFKSYYMVLSLIAVTGCKYQPDYKECRNTVTGERALIDVHTRERPDGYKLMSITQWECKL